MYESRGPQSAAIYGCEMSKIEARGILHEVSTLAEKIDRLLSGKECPGLTGDKGEGDLHAFWASVFNRDLNPVLTEIASLHYRRPEDALSAAAQWEGSLHQRTRELLSYGFTRDCEFLERVESAIPKFSKLFEIANPEEPQLQTSHALRRMALLHSLFASYPKPESPIQTAFVETPSNGIVTVVRYRTGLQGDDYRLAVGINTSSLEWDSAGFNFDQEGRASSLFLVNSVGRVAVLKPGFKPPTADDLCREVVSTFLDNRNALTFTRPTQPNTKWFRTSSQGA
jgi:hypothetical protein